MKVGDVVMVIPCKTVMDYDAHYDCAIAEVVGIHTKTEPRWPIHCNVMGEHAELLEESFHPDELYSLGVNVR